MPFIDKNKREGVLKGHVDTVGDRCFLYYKYLKDMWDKEPRWTTAHTQYKQLFQLTDKRTAQELAWWVHFILNVIPYEKRKRIENGDVGKKCNLDFQFNDDVMNSTLKAFIQYIKSEGDTDDF